jgi:hypothetical protein
MYKNQSKDQEDTVLFFVAVTVIHIGGLIFG